MNWSISELPEKGPTSPPLQRLRPKLIQPPKAYKELSRRKLDAVYAEKAKGGPGTRQMAKWKAILSVGGKLETANGFRLIQIGTAQLIVMLL